MNREEMIAKLVEGLVASTDLSEEDAAAQIAEVTSGETDQEVAERLG